MAAAFWKIVKIMLWNWEWVTHSFCVVAFDVKYLEKVTFLREGVLTLIYHTYSQVMEMEMGEVFNAYLQVLLVVNISFC